MSFWSRGHWRPFGLAAAVVAADQVTKLWAETNLPAGVVRPWLPGLLNLQLVYNRGAAFSMLTQATTLLAAISALVVVALAIWLLQQRRLGLWQWLAAGLLLGGAAGNGLDRWRLGAVIDFVAFAPIEFPVFNLADVAINLAVLCFAIDVVLRQRRHGA